MSANGEWEKEEEEDMSEAKRGYPITDSATVATSSYAHMAYE